MQKCIVLSTDTSLPLPFLTSSYFYTPPCGIGIRYCIRQWIISQCTNALLALCSPASPATSTSSWRATVAPESVAKLKYQIAYLNFSNGNLSEADSNCRDVLGKPSISEASKYDRPILETEACRGPYFYITYFIVGRWVGMGHMTSRFTVTVGHKRFTRLIVFFRWREK